MVRPPLPDALWSPTAFVRFAGSVVGNDLYEHWFPLAAAIALAVRQPWLFVVVAVYLVLFSRALDDVVRRDVPDVVERGASCSRAGLA